MENRENASINVEMESYDPMPAPTLHAFDTDQSHHSTNPRSNFEDSEKSNGKNVEENKLEYPFINPENTADANNPEASANMLNTFPIFLGLVTLADIVLLGISIVLNKGIEPLKDNPMIGPSGKILDKMGARVVPEILDGEYYRLITPMFLHVGVVHLVMNLLFQLRTGVVLERSIGSMKMSFIYILCGIGGNISSGIFLPHLLSVGASGALFGLVGVLCAINIKSWKVIKHQPVQRKSLVLTLLGLVINLVIGLLPMIDNFCHIGGFIVGIFCGFVLLPAAVVTQKKTEFQEGEYFLSYKSKENFIYVAIGVVGLITYFVAGLVVLFDHVDAKEWCHWCSNMDCPSTWSICDGYS